MEFFSNLLCEVSEDSKVSKVEGLSLSIGKNLIDLFNERNNMVASRCVEFYEISVLHSYITYISILHSSLHCTNPACV